MPICKQKRSQKVNDDIAYGSSEQRLSKAESTARVESMKEQKGDR